MMTIPGAPLLNTLQPEFPGEIPSPVSKKPMKTAYM
jgi:hypothetical protein